MPRYIKLYPAGDMKLKSSLFREVMGSFANQGSLSMAGYGELGFIKLAAFQELKPGLLKEAYLRRKS
jgi:hypothetical protein